MKKNKTAYIIAAGPISNYNYVKEQIPNDAFVLCADGGIKHCEKLKILPNVIISDFDSSENKYPTNCEVITYPSEKDDTDFSLCVKKAISLGFENIVTFGAVGGRIDHTLGAIQILSYCADRNVKCSLLEHKNEVYMLNSGESMAFNNPHNKNISIFSYSEKCQGVFTKGVKYHLNNAELTNSFPLGISNKAISETVEISIENGKLLIILSQD